MRRVATLVGARPQFVKAGMLSRAFRRNSIEETLIHSGQHYDRSLSDRFFEELALPEPVHNLNVGSGSHAEQTGAIMDRLEHVLLQMKNPPDWLVIFGDTNTTLAGAVVAAKLNIRLAHVEAGLRSFDRTMPEEINRIVADRLATVRFCPSQSALDQLIREGMAEGSVFVGDIMYDSLKAYLPRARRLVREQAIEQTTLSPYILATVHRAGNVDDPDRLAAILEALSVAGLPVYWPLHPRTERRITEFGFEIPENVTVLEPTSYLETILLADLARWVVTDSGGLQKEAYWLGTPCITLRAETEWPETLIDGWNVVVDVDSKLMGSAMRSKPGNQIGAPYGDGHAAQRMVENLFPR